MRLQVQVLPLQDRRSASKAPLPPTQHSTLPQGALSFLEICEDNISLNELCTKICARFARIYPHRPPLNIKKLQDVYGNDLDLEYTVRDVFDDKSADQQNSVVRVLQEPTTRNSSVPPQSALRPHIHGLTGRKRTHGGPGGLRDDIMMGGTLRRGSEPRSGRSKKRQRIQEISRDEEEDADPDLPLPSNEPNSDAVGDLMQWSGTGQEAPPSQAMGDSQQPRIGDLQTHTHSSSSHPFPNPNHQVLSDTLTVPESPTQQNRHQPMNDQHLQANGQVNDPHDGATKSESVDGDNSGLLHSIPRSSIASPFPEGEGIVAVNLAVAQQDRLPTPRPQTFQGKAPTGGLQSIITPSNTPDTSGHQVAQLSNKLKRPNPSMFRASNRQTGSPDGASNIYDAIETDEDRSPCLPPLRSPPEKRSKRHNSFTSIMNGQSPMPNASNRGNSRHSSGSEGAAARSYNKKANYPPELKWLRAHDGSHDRPNGSEDKRDSEDGSDSNRIPKKGVSQSPVRDRTHGGEATAGSERQQPEKEAKEHTVLTREQIKRLKKAAQEAEEIQRKEEEGRIAQEANERRQKEAEAEQRAKEAKAKDKQLVKERQNQERKERAQKQAQEKALKAEKAEKEAEARRLYKKEEEKISSEAVENDSLQKRPRRTQEVEQASSSGKRKRAGRLLSEPSEPSAEVTRGSKPGGGRRMSTTPLIPRAVFPPKDVQLNEQNASTTQKTSARDASLDSQMPIPIEPGVPMRRSVSFLVDGTPQPVTNPPSSVNPTPVPALIRVPRKVTKVYPPGMGPDNLKSLMENPPEKPVIPTPRPRGRPKRGAIAKTQTENSKKGAKGKVNDGKSVPNPVPNPVKNPTPTNEIVISSGNSSASSYHSETDPGGDTITVLATPKPVAADTRAPSNPMTRANKENGSPKPQTSPYTLRSKSLPRNPPRAPPHVSSPTRSPVRYVSRSPSSSYSESDSDSDSTSGLTQSKSVSSSSSGSSSSTPSRSRSDSILGADSGDENAGGGISTSSQASSGPLPQSDKGINHDRNDALPDIPSNGKEATDRLNNSSQKSAQPPTATPTNKVSTVRSPVTGNSSQAKPSLNSFPSLSQLGSQKFDNDSQGRKSVAGSQKPFPPLLGAQGGINSTPAPSKEDEESSFSSDDESSDDDSSDSDDGNGLPQDRRARNSSESRGKVSRGFKGLLSGMFSW
ncbi:MAG: hypothetical protein M1840_001053 [Geoglossum simile]|nr:MAG: hypothetical protein M1840_001053 [Geoglossum simile]